MPNRKIAIYNSPITKSKETKEATTQIIITMMSKYIERNIWKPITGELMPNPDKNKVQWTIWCDLCGNELVCWKDNKEDLNPWEIVKYGQQERKLEKGDPDYDPKIAKSLIFSPAGNSKLFPTVYKLYNDITATYCKGCFEHLKCQNKYE